MVLLLDGWTTYARLLHESFRAAGVVDSSVVLQYDGFLPEGVRSPYAYFTGAEGKDAQSGAAISGSPIYFSDIPVPDLWEPRVTGGEGEIYRYETLRAKFFFAAPKHRRFVNAIDWMDAAGKVRFTDHYDRFGHRFAQTTFDFEGRPVLRTYYDRDGQETVVDHFVANSVLLYREGKTHYFENRNAFYAYYLEEVGLATDRVSYNSLSRSFVLAHYLHQRNPENSSILFWQEPFGSELPGNMRIIVDGDFSGTETIAIQSQQAWRALEGMDEPQDKFLRLGFVYPLSGGCGSMSDALIFTNSDNIEHIEDLVRSAPGMVFHIAAQTEMSTKLQSLDSYSNVRLYPGVTLGKIEKLLGKCGVYLDINHFAQVGTIVLDAFRSGLVLFAFDSTVHDKSFIPDSHVYAADDWGALAQELCRLGQDEAGRADALACQREHACVASADDYRRLLGFS